MTNIFEQYFSPISSSTVTIGGSAVPIVSMSINTNPNTTITISATDMNGHQTTITPDQFQEFKRRINSTYGAFMNRYSDDDGCMIKKEEKIIDWKTELGC